MDSEDKLAVSVIVMVLLIIVTCNTAHAQQPAITFDTMAWVPCSAALMDSVAIDSLFIDIETPWGKPLPGVPTDSIEISCLDTVDYYIDTVNVEIPCPDGFAGCMVLHYAPKVILQAKTERRIIGRFKVDGFEELAKWKIERAYKEER